MSEVPFNPENIGEQSPDQPRIITEAEKKEIWERINAFLNKNCFSITHTGAEEAFIVQENGSVVLLDHSVRINKPYEPKGETIPPEIIAVVGILACREKITTFSASNLESAGGIHFFANHRTVKFPYLQTVSGDLWLTQTETVVTPSLKSVGGSTNLSRLDPRSSQFGELSHIGGTMAMRAPRSAQFRIARPDNSHFRTWGYNRYATSDPAAKAELISYLNSLQILTGAISSFENAVSTERGISLADETEAEEENK